MGGWICSVLGCWPTNRIDVRGSPPPAMDTRMCAECTEARDQALAQGKRKRPKLRGHGRRAWRALRRRVVRMSRVRWALEHPGKA